MQLSLIFSNSTKTCIPHTSPPQREDRGSGSQPPVGGISQSNVGPLCMLGRSIAAHAVFGETLANMYCISFGKINNSGNEMIYLCCLGSCCSAASLFPHCRETWLSECTQTAQKRKKLHVCFGAGRSAERPVTATVRGGSRAGTVPQHPHLLK